MAAPDYRYRERSDTYSRVVLRRDRLRVICCKNDIQWILQWRRQSSSTRIDKRWEAVGYFLTRDALSQAWKRRSGSGAVEVDSLPEHYRRTAGVAS